MAKTIINGVKNKGNIPSVKAMSPEALAILAEIQGGNTVEDQNINELNAVLQPLEKTVPRIEGTSLPVKVHNVKFTKGGVQTSSKEFRPYYDKFDLGKSQGYNVQAFDYSDETLEEYENLGINPLEEQLESVKDISSAYRETYLPFHRLQAVITGSTLSAKLPTVDPGTTTGAGAYKRAFGWARGEDFADFLTAKGTDTKVNLYRVINGSASDPLQSTDITDLIDDIKATKHYGKGGGQKGIIAIGAYRTIQNLANLANAPENKDIAIFGNITNMFGAMFKAVEGLDPDFIHFFDMSYLDKLIVHGVNVTENQRGLALVMKNDLKTFKSYEDIQGAKMRIYPEERYMPWRLSGGILSVNPDHAEVGGLMTAGSAGEIALENFVARIIEEYEHID